MTAAALTVTVASLTGLLRAETALLGAGGTRDIAELAAAKQRLAASLEQQIATLDRERPDWHAALDAAAAAALAQAMAALHAAADANGTMLERQIAFSRELLGAVAAEARRLAGTTQETYGASGTVSRSDAPTPLAVNTSL